jgi:hypothetical protein
MAIETSNSIIINNSTEFSPLLNGIMVSHSWGVAGIIAKKKELLL